MRDYRWSCCQITPFTGVKCLSGFWRLGIHFCRDFGFLRLKITFDYSGSIINDVTQKTRFLDPQSSLSSYGSTSQRRTISYIKIGRHFWTILNKSIKNILNPYSTPTTIHFFNLSTRKAKKGTPFSITHSSTSSSTFFILFILIIIKWKFFFLSCHFNSFIIWHLRVKKVRKFSWLKFFSFKHKKFFFEKIYFFAEKVKKDLKRGCDVRIFEIAWIHTLGFCRIMLTDVDNEIYWHDKRNFPFFCFFKLLQNFF